MEDNEFNFPQAQPELSDTVIYHGLDGSKSAAIVTAVAPESLHVTVLNIYGVRGGLLAHHVNPPSLAPSDGYGFTTWPHGVLRNAVEDHFEPGSEEQLAHLAALEDWWAALGAPR